MIVKGMDSKRCLSGFVWQRFLFACFGSFCGCRSGSRRVDFLFLRELGRRRIAIHYGKEELAADLQTVEALAAR